MDARRLGRILLASGALALLLDQLVQHTALRDGYLFGRRIAPFDPPIFSPHARAALERFRACVAAGESDAGGISPFDPWLGWTTRQPGDRHRVNRERAGTRAEDEVPAREEPPEVPPEVPPEEPPEEPSTRRLAVAVGDSFVQGAEVRAGESWPAIAEQLDPGLLVENLGTGGYGADQALLRLERDGLPMRPEEVWFGVLPSAAPRIVTVYVQAFTHWSPSPAFKPRFEIDASGELALVRNPAGSLARLVELLDSQEEFLAAVGGHDRWIGRVPLAYAPFGSSPLHHSAAARIWLTHRERLGRPAKPWLTDRESEVYLLLRAIVLRAKNLAEGAGSSFVAVILPDRHDLEDRARNGVAYWQDLVDDLSASGTAVLDASSGLAAAGGAGNPSLWASGGHYSPLGNRTVAQQLLARGD